MWKSLGYGVVGVVLKYCAWGSIPVRWDSAFSPRGVFYDGAGFSVEKSIGNKLPVMGGYSGIIGKILLV